MPYVTWDEVAEAVQGEQRLKDILLPHIETADNHPYFDQQLAVAERRANVELERAGYVVPLTNVTDALLKHSIIGLLVGLLTESSSSREQWMIDLYNAAVAYFRQLGKGDATVIGAEVDVSPDATGLTIWSGTDEAPVFDYLSGGAEIRDVFANLGVGPGRGWRR